MQTCPSCGELVPNEYVLCVWCGMDLTAERIRRSGIIIDNRAAIDRMRRVVIDPDTTFKEISLLPDLRGGKIIFYALGVMITLNMITVISKISGLQLNSEEFEAIDIVSIGITSTFAFSISGKFVINLVLLVIQPVILLGLFIFIWKMSARIMSLLSRSFGGRGDKEKIRAVVGYSMLPVFFGWTLAWLIRLITPATDPVASSSYENIQSAVVSFAEEGFGVVGLVFIYIGWIWATVLGIIGMKHVGKLSWVEAVIVAGLPYVIFIALVL